MWESFLPHAQETIAQLNARSIATPFSISSVPNYIIALGTKEKKQDERGAIENYPRGFHLEEAHPLCSCGAGGGVASRRPDREQSEKNDFHFPRIAPGGQEQSFFEMYYCTLIL